MEFIIYLVIIIFVIWLIIKFIQYVVIPALIIAAAVGFIWGGGTALVNYIISIKENIIDSNR
ncbi:MAG: hypothetical protein LBP76_04785 [Treponema sp.]|jgi:hypothetical protein|nr:hypothetical protein [Treponema sp.]